MNADPKTASLQPPVDVFETKDGVLLLTDLPGIDPKNVEITLERNVLSLRAQTPVEPPVEGATLLYGEYDAGNYERSFTVSAEIDRERIAAEFKQGVLRLALHKAPEHQPRKITIRTTE